MNITGITLKFTPYARAKLQFICDHYNHEVGAMGLAETADPFLVTDLYIPKQKCSTVFVDMDAADIADNMFMKYCDPEGPHKLKPHQVGRIYIHTHPSGCLNPSQHDENIFAESFGSMPWAMMVILPKGGPLYARIRVSLGNDVNLQMMLKEELTLTTDFKGANHAEWKAEITPKITVQGYAYGGYGEDADTRGGYKGRSQLPSGYWGKQVQQQMPLSKKQQKRAARAAARENLALRQETTPTQQAITDAVAEITQEIIIGAKSHGEEALSTIPFPRQQGGVTPPTLAEGTYVDALWSMEQLKWVPPSTPERVEYLKEYGFKEVINVTNGTQRFTLSRGETFYDLPFSQAWAFVDFEENINAERDDFERAMNNLTHTRKYGDTVITGDIVTNVYKKVRANCLWQLRGSVDACDALILTHDEMLLAEKVVSGELTADAALFQIQDMYDESDVIENGGSFIEYCGTPPAKPASEEETQIMLGES